MSLTSFLTKYLRADSKGEIIMRSLADYLNKLNVPMENITAFATDGAPAMIVRYRGFASLLKGMVPSVRTIHCVLHRNHLIAKNLSSELYAALKVCIRSVNEVKVRHLSSRSFAMCEKNDETYNQLNLHTEVRWSSRGNYLQ